MSGDGKAMLQNLIQVKMLMQQHKSYPVLGLFIVPSASADVSCSSEMDMTVADF